MTAPCPCGGATHVESFDWPGKPLQWFIRCESCGGMSDTEATKEAAEGLRIAAEQAAEANPA